MSNFRRRLILRNIKKDTITYEFIRCYTVTYYNNYISAAYNTARMTALTQTENDAPALADSGDIIGYLIPIPNNTTTITVNTPNYISGICLWNNVDGAIVRVVDDGWHSTTGTNVYTLDGDYDYLSVNVKNTSNTTISSSVDTSEWTIIFA